MGASLAGRAPISLGLSFRRPVLVTAVLDGKPIWTVRSTARGRVVLGRRWNTVSAGNGRHRLRIVVWRRGDHKPLADLRRTILVANVAAASRAPAAAPAPAPAPAAASAGGHAGAGAPGHRPPPGAVALPGTIVWRGDYETGDLSQFRTTTAMSCSPSRGRPGGSRW